MMGLPHNLSVAEWGKKIMVPWDVSGNGTQKRTPLKEKQGML
jgi:hypothetical protein